ncbi:hypothetical protein ABTY61_22720 [Kitasatospora sp. NPDC096128]|uniref:hypothetical protein n=1 Tax=Kitasatospora sp. NPDC096128 TaxID=3155547 RepID=UPI0033283121
MPDTPAPDWYERLRAELDAPGPRHFASADVTAALDAFDRTRHIPTPAADLDDGENTSPPRPPT